jgi:ethanolamine transporter EutH
LLIVMFARVLKGLGRSFRKIGAFVLLLGVIAIVSVIVAIPLWYFSSNFAAGYTIFVIILLSAALLYALISRLVRLGSVPGALRLYLNRRILPILKTVAAVVASVAVIYAITLLVSRGYTVVSIAAAVLWILLLGFLRYARRGKR